MSENQALTWIRVGVADLLAEGRVTTVQAGHHAICLTRTAAGYGAISNRCAHQGGPLGDGFLQNGYVVCPWHGWEYNPQTGDTQGDFGRMMLGKFHEVTIPLWGEIGTTFNLFEAQLDDKDIPERRAYISRLWQNWRQEKEKNANGWPGRPSTKRTHHAGSE